MTKSPIKSPYKIQVRLLHPNARIPTRAKDNDAGADLYAVEDEAILPMQRRLIKTGISMAIPAGFYGRIAPRSGLALKAGVDVLGGVVDAGYRGEIGVILINLSDGGEEDVFQIKAGDKIAQIVITPCYTPDFEQVEELVGSDRGKDGFGSTGIQDKKLFAGEEPPSYFSNVKRDDSNFREGFLEDLMP